MKQISRLCRGPACTALLAVFAVALAACGTSAHTASPQPAPNVTHAASHPAAADPTPSSLEALALSWGPLDAAGMTSTACELLPPQAVSRYGGPVTSSNPEQDTVIDGVDYATATDSYGNAKCNIIWYQNETTQVEVQVDFAHHDQGDSAQEWLEDDNNNQQPVAAGAGEYVETGESGSQVFNETAAPYNGGLMDVACTGLNASICTTFLKVAIARAPAYTPTDTLYGASQP
jgi:hypothetical protein